VQYGTNFVELKKEISNKKKKKENVPF